MNYKTLKFKTTLSSEGVATPQNPDAPTGIHGNSITYEVTNIPSSVPLAEVARLFNATTLLKGYSCDFAQLAPGAIIL